MRDVVGFRDIGNRLSKPGLLQDFQDICRRLGEGRSLLPRHYRARIDDPTSPDRLLEEYGIKHLHLGRQNSDDILYCIEFKHLVVMLQVSGHANLDIDPPGERLLAEYAHRIHELGKYHALGQILREFGIWLGLSKD